MPGTHSGVHETPLPRGNTQPQPTRVGVCLPDSAADPRAHGAQAFALAVPQAPRAPLTAHLPAKPARLLFRSVSKAATSAYPGAPYFPEGRLPPPLQRITTDPLSLCTHSLHLRLPPAGTAELEAHSAHWSCPRCSPQGLSSLSTG